MKRRQLITAAAAATGLAAAAKIADLNGLIPPDGGGIYGPGESLTYAAQSLLTRHTLAREFTRAQISEKPFANGRVPKDAPYQKHLAEGFANWRLNIDGLVTRPATFSIADLKAQPASSQITQVTCEEGWCYIAQWTGVPLAHLLNLAGVSPQARYIVYFALNPSEWDSIDMADALHPQTLVTHGMNDADLPAGFGGPLRLRVPRQLGYKSLKYINRITVTDSLQSFGKGLGSAAPEDGYAWYAGI